VLSGKLAFIVPLLVAVKVPIVTGLAKLPEALLSCAVKTLPLVKVQLVVNGTFTTVPAHNEKGLPDIVPVWICWEKQFEKVTKKKHRTPIFFIDFNY
jgi:hypothetical protein